VIQAAAAAATPAVMPKAPAVGLWLRAYGMSGTASSRYGASSRSESYRSSESKPLSGVRTLTAFPSYAWSQRKKRAASPPATRAYAAIMPRYSGRGSIPIQLSRTACKAEPSGVKVPTWRIVEDISSVGK